MIITGPFVTYRQRYADGKEIYNYGKLPSAFIEKHVGLVEVEILAFHNSMDAARELYKSTYEQRDGILCHTNDTIYRTIQAASAATGVSVGSIRHHIAGRYGYEAPRGFTFQIYPAILFN